jgi:hypothetical protein
MSQTNLPITCNVVKKVMTLTETYVDIFDFAITNADMTMNMKYGSVDLGNVDIGIASGTCINLSNYGAFNNSQPGSSLPAYYDFKPTYNFTIWMNYTTGGMLQACIDVNDDHPEIEFTCSFSSYYDNYGTNIYAIDSITEKTTDAGLTIQNKVTMNGGVINIGTDASSNNTINIATDASGARFCNIGNTNAGSKIVLNGDISIPNSTLGTVVYNNSTDITWTNISTVAKHVGNICYVSAKATLTANNSLSADTQYDMFTLSPTNSFATSNVVVSNCLLTGLSPRAGTVISTVNTADYSIILPAALTATSSITVNVCLSFIL